MVIMHDDVDSIKVALNSGKVSKVQQHGTQRTSGSITKYQALDPLNPTGRRGDDSESLETSLTAEGAASILHDSCSWSHHHAHQQRPFLCGKCSLCE